MMKKNRRKTGKMKRAGAVVLLAVLLCGLTACGESGSRKKSGAEDSYIEDTQSRTSEDDAGQNSEPGEREDTKAGGGEDIPADSGAENAEGGAENAEAESLEEAPQDTEKESEQEDEESKEPAAPPEFSTTDWKSLEFALNGQVFAFPLTWSDIEAAGYLFREEYAQEVLEAGYYTTSLTAKNDERELLSIQFKNFGEEDQKLENCYVYGVKLDSYYNPTAILCNGVTFGMSFEDVKALMGEPDDYYTNVTEDEPSPERIYENAKYYVEGTLQKSLIQFTFSDRALTGIQLVNTD